MRSRAGWETELETEWKAGWKAGVAINQINKQTELPITVTEISSIPASKC